MNDVIFNNDVKVTVTQNPDIAEDGDTVEFLATPELLFATEDRIVTDNYSFAYIWMVSYNGGLSYQKTGIGTNKLTLENINTKIFNNSIYKVKVILEDLEDFLLTENGDRILTQIGEVLLFNNNNALLSIQTDVVTNNTTVASISNTTDISNTPLNFLNIEGTIDEVAVFDNTITEDVRAEILSLQSRIDINNQAKFVDGEVIENASLPSTPNTDIELPNQTLSIQADCYTSVEKTFGGGPTIRYKQCEKSGSSFLWFNCNSLGDCTSSGGCDPETDLYCEGDGTQLAALVNSIQYPDGQSLCCDSMEKVCDSDQPWDFCEEKYSQALPTDPVVDSYGNKYQKYTYQGPCGKPDFCETEDYTPSPPFFVANNCNYLEFSNPVGNVSGPIDAATDARTYCAKRCIGIHEPASVSVSHGSVVSPTVGVVGYAASLGTIGAGGAIAYITWGVAALGFATGVVATGGIALACIGLAGLSYVRSYYSSGGIISADIYVTTWCNDNGSWNGSPSNTGQNQKVSIKQCKQKICKQKWTCVGRTNNNDSMLFSRVLKDLGTPIQVGPGVFVKTDKLINPDSSYTIHDSEPVYNCDTSGASISFERKEGTCEWNVKSKCCPSGKKCTWTVDSNFANNNPGTYNTITLDATNKPIQSYRLYSINTSGSLDFIEAKDSCSAKCSGEGCKVYEEWKILSVEPTEVPCNEDFDIVAFDEITNGGHGQNGSEITVATDAKCVQDSTPAKRTIKIAKIVKRYTYKDPGNEGSYENIRSEVYNRLGYTLANDGLYSAFLIIYEEQPVSLPSPQDLKNLANNDPYIKKTIKFDKKQLYRHSKIVLEGTVPLMRVNCDKCKPVYEVSKAEDLQYPCNDRNYRISGCVDSNGSPLPYAYGNCLKDNSDKNTKIKIVTVTEIKEPTDDMIKKLGKPNTDFFRTPGEAKTEGSKRVGSTGIVCSAT